jgi:hypothetical protein
LKIPSFLKLSKYVIEVGTILYFFGFIALSLANSKYGVVAENIFSLKYVTVAILLFIFIFIILFLFKKTIISFSKISEEKKAYKSLFYFLDLLWTYLWLTVIIFTLFNLRTSNSSSILSLSFNELGGMQKLFLKDFEFFNIINSFLNFESWHILVMSIIGSVTLILFLAIDRHTSQESFSKSFKKYSEKVLNSIVKGCIYLFSYIIGFGAISRVWDYVRDIDFFVKDTFEGFPIASILIGCITILYWTIFIYASNFKAQKILYNGFKENTPSLKLIKDVLFNSNRTLLGNGYIILAIVLTFIIFSYAFYRYTPAYLFGGQLKKVEIILNDEVQESSNDCESYLIDNLSDTLFILNECSNHNKTIELSKQNVQEIIYEPIIDSEEK